MTLNPCVLVVDEDIDVCQDICDLLRYFGFDAESVHNCRAALQRLTSVRYCSVILDRELEADEGVIEWLRVNKRTEPVILMSEMADYDLLIEAVNAGAVDLIAKPVQQRQLRQSLELAQVPAPSAARR